MKNLNKNPSLSLMLMLIFHTFFASIPAVDWQGYGNMSATNLTEIWAYIDNNIGNVTGNDYGPFSVGFSDRLNQLWDPAWNVFTLKTVAGKDSVVYGYAFRNHWMWYNGFISQGNYLTFIIWKDYNCQTWTSYTLAQSKVPTTLKGFSGQHFNQAMIVAQKFRNDSIDDIWGAGKKFMDQIEKQPNFSGNDKAYSGIFTQYNIGIPFIGRFCSVGGNYIALGIGFKYQQFGNCSYFKPGKIDHDQRQTQILQITDQISIITKVKSFLGLNQLLLPPHLDRKLKFFIQGIINLFLSKFNIEQYLIANMSKYSFYKQILHPILTKVAIAQNYFNYYLKLIIEFDQSFTINLLNLE